MNVQPNHRMMLSAGCVPVGGVDMLSQRPPNKTQSMFLIEKLCNSNPLGWLLSTFNYSFRDDFFFDPALLYIWKA